MARTVKDAVESLLWACGVDPAEAGDIRVVAQQVIVATNHGAKRFALDQTAVPKPKAKAEG